VGTLSGPRSAVRQRRLIGTGFGLCAAVLAASARAEPTAAERAIAETLYERGQAQMKDGNVAAACDSFAESQRIDPGTGILLNLASCHETAGRLASAWVEYREAAVALRHEGRPDRLRFANEHLATIEPRLAHLVIGGDRPPGDGVVVVVLDGLELGRAAWSVAIPVDAGAHSLVAHFNNGPDWTTTVRVRDGERRFVEVPPPAPASSAAATDGSAHDRLQPVLSTGSAAPALSLSATTSDSVHRATVAKWQTAGLTLGAVGLVSLGVGGYLGLHAATLWSDRNHSCPMDICTRQGLAAGADAATFATAATWTIAGGVTALAGAFLMLLPSRAAERPGTAARVMRSVQVNPTGRVAIGGSF